VYQNPKSAHLSHWNSHLRARMQTTFEYQPTEPDALQPARVRPRTLSAVLQAQDELRSEPIVTLATAIQQLGLMDARQIQDLTEENPNLFRNQSSQLCDRFLITFEELHHALARTAGIVEVDALHFMLEPGAADLLPMRLLRSQDLLVLGVANDHLLVATWRPTDDDLLAHLRAVTGRPVMMLWSDRDSIVARLDHLDHAAPIPAPETQYRQQQHHALQHPQPTLDHAHAAPFPGLSADHAINDLDIEALMDAAAHELATGQEQEEANEVSESSSMVRLVKRMIMDAQALRASDIHIETNPGEQFTRIRLRRDGDLEPYQRLAPALRAPLVSRLKVMARLDISERRRPQDGKINFADFGGDHLELRVAIMPTHDGMEDVVLRLLSSSKPIPLARLGLQQRDTETVSRLSQRSFGLILAVGPTGSGKTTTLHSLLAEINTEDKKIWTAEDPIEITHPGLRQVQVNPKIGLTFANAMRGFLRADPDGIMIGEIRDAETAKIAIEGSLTGHLVLSTLHTNSASESVVRLLDLGMDAMNFADSLVGIVAQRLVRALCTHCCASTPLLPEQWSALLKEYIAESPLSELEASERLLLAAGVQQSQDIEVKEARGCPHCNGKGYKGRVGIYEILENSPAVRQLIQHSARPTELFEAAVRAGMHSLRHDALEKWVAGQIDLRQARSAFI
jgi:type II secretory ATPase GspE/PulE/Tfp pilus assembly ATPase PilB-like protein